MNTRQTADDSLRPEPERGKWAGEERGKRGRRESRERKSLPPFFIQQHELPQIASMNPQTTALAMDSYSSSSDSNSDIDEEEAPLFFPSSNNFNAATVNPKNGKNIGGVAYGVDYEKRRRERRERAMKKQFEAFDIEMEDSGHASRSYSFRCISNIMICIVVLSSTIAILHRRHQQKAATEQEHKLIHHLSKPSSRWGHRFDDDDDFPVGEHRDELVPSFDSGHKGTTNIPKYHIHGHNANKPHKKKLAPKDMELDMEEWEEYEMEVSHVLSNSKPGWDIHNNPRKPENKASHEFADDYNEHWIKYLDQESEQPYYFNVDTNTTQWETPEVNDDIIVLVYDYESGELLVPGT